MKRLSLFALLFAFSARAQVPSAEDDDDNPANMGQPPPQQPQQRPPAPQQRPPNLQYRQQPQGYPPQSYPPQYQYQRQNQYPPGQYPQGQYQYPNGQYEYPAGRQYQYPQQYPSQYPQQQPYGNQYQYRDQYGRPIQQPQQPPRQPPPYGQPQQPAQPGLQPPYGAPQPPTTPAVPATIVLSTANDAARTDALACVDALEHYHLAVARTRCGDALAKDPDLALAHLWMAQAAATPAVTAAELARAAELGRKATTGERLLIDAHRAWKESRIPEAKKAYDQLCGFYAGEKRAFLARGLFRQVALGDLDGAVADYKKAASLDEKYAAAYNFLGFALAEQNKADEAATSLRKYASLAPSEPNAHDSLAALALRNGDLGEAMAEEKKALTIDPKFLVAHATLGDALLLSGKPKDARKEYAFLDDADDPTLRHDGAMRAARTHLFEDRSLEAEKALVKEADLSRKASRPAEAVEAFLDAARIQIERGALAEAGRGVKEATESLKRPSPAESKEAKDVVPLLDEGERRRLSIELAETRAMLFAALFERDVAEARADEVKSLLQLAGDPRPDDRARVLKGWIAYRVGDDKAALAALEKSTSPRMRFAYALTLARTGDAARAKPIMDELSRRTANDLDTALTRPRAIAWLRTNAGTATK